MSGVGGEWGLVVRKNCEFLSMMCGTCTSIVCFLGMRVWYIHKYCVLCFVSGGEVAYECVGG